MCKNLPDSVKKLMKAYALSIKEYDGKYIHLFNGRKIEYLLCDIRSDEEIMANPSIDDIFHYLYFKGEPVNTVHPTDAGRIRHDELLMKMYGMSPMEVWSNFVAIKWCPTLVNQTIYVTKINNVHLQFLKVSEELDDYSDLACFLRNSGVFNWRTIKGSNRLSPHSFGIAMDIAAEYSDYWLCNDVNHKDDISISRPENKMPQIIVDVFEKHGFIWGGRWVHYDTMHFEYRPELLI